MIPSQADNEKRRLDWLREAIEEGDAFLKAQKGYTRIPEAINTVMSEDTELRSPDLSGTTCNQFGKEALDLVAGCTDVKPFWEYKVENRRYEKQALVLGKLALRWWLQRFIDLRYADGVKYSIVAGTGWLYQYYDPVAQDIGVEACDPRDVIPIRPATDETIQDAVGVIYRRQRTVNYLKGRYPEKADQIRAERDGSLASMISETRAGRLLSALGSPFHDALFGDQAHKERQRIPTATLYTCYLKDDRVNKSSTDVGMGDFDEYGTPATSWSYIVKPGERLFPNGRCVEFTKSAILYDGPSIYWHGMFPFSKLTLDPWPFNGCWLGKAVLWDLIPLQKALNKLLRVVDDHMAKVAQPDLIVDRNAISRETMSKMNTRLPGRKLWTRNALSKQSAQIVYPQPLPREVFDAIAFYIEKMSDLSGNKDMSSLMRLNQIPSADTVEKLIESLSPSVRLRSRVIEAFMREFATMFAYNASQFYSLSMRLTYLGEEGVTRDDFDSQPGNMIPDYLGDDYDMEGNIRADARQRGPRPLFDRTREFLRQVQFRIAPASLLAASEIQRKLTYLQLSRAGLVDHWTLLEVLGIPNVGKPPEGANDITTRLVAEQQMGLGMNISPVGRKASGQSMPRLTVKESG